MYYAHLASVRFEHSVCGYIYIVSSLQGTSKYRNSVACLRLILPTNFFQAYMQWIRKNIMYQKPEGCQGSVGDTIWQSFFLYNHYTKITKIIK